MRRNWFERKASHWGAAPTLGDDDDDDDEDEDGDDDDNGQKDRL